MHKKNILYCVLCFVVLLFHNCLISTPKTNYLLKRGMISVIVVASLYGMWKLGEKYNTSKHENMLKEAIDNYTKLKNNITEILVARGKNYFQDYIIPIKQCIQTMKNIINSPKDTIKKTTDLEKLESLKDLFENGVLKNQLNKKSVFVVDSFAIELEKSTEYYQIKKLSEDLDQFINKNHTIFSNLPDYQKLQDVLKKNNENIIQFQRHIAKPLPATSSFMKSIKNQLYGLLNALLFLNNLSIGLLSNTIENLPDLIDQDFDNFLKISEDGNIVDKNIC